jgi:predicted NACHT family NTPase
VEKVLWEIINRAHPAAKLAGRFDQPAAADAPLPSIVRFQTSATEQEIWRGALGVPDAREHVIAFFREIENLTQYPKPSHIEGFVDLDDQKTRIDASPADALAELKSQLREKLGEANVISSGPVRLAPLKDQNGNVLVYEDGPREGEPRIDVSTDHLKQMCDEVFERLKRIITRQMDEFWKAADAGASSSRELELERLEHERFGRERAPTEAFVGRESQLTAIAAYVQSDSRQPLVIHGASGSGKTALLARAAQLAAENGKPIVRFLGTTPKCGDLRPLLVILCQELRERNAMESPIPSDLNELIKEFHAHLNTAASDEPIALYLDALDQLSDADNGRSLTWLPFGKLPEHCKLIVS